MEETVQLTRQTLKVVPVGKPVLPPQTVQRQEQQTKQQFFEPQVKQRSLTGYRDFQHITSVQNQLSEGISFI
jgi:hypothetical protein